MGPGISVPQQQDVHQATLSVWAAGETALSFFLDGGMPVTAPAGKPAHLSPEQPLNLPFPSINGPRHQLMLQQLMLPQGTDGSVWCLLHPPSHPTHCPLLPSQVHSDSTYCSSYVLTVFAHNQEDADGNELDFGAQDQDRVHGGEPVEVSEGRRVGGPG